MTPQGFVAAFLPTAQQVKSGTGLDEDTLLAQWALETAWGSVFAGKNNLGNIRCSPTTFCDYASVADFARAAIDTFHNGLYEAVLATAGKSIETQIAALGASPWDAGHYGNPAGSALIPYAKEIDMFNDLDRAYLTGIGERVAYLVGQHGQSTVSPVKPSMADLEADIKAIKPTDLNSVLGAVAAVKTELDSVAAMLAKIEAALKSA